MWFYSFHPHCAIEGPNIHLSLLFALHLVDSKGEIPFLLTLRTLILASLLGYKSKQGYLFTAIKAFIVFSTLHISSLYLSQESLG